MKVKLFPVATTKNSSPEDCAAVVLDVVPAVMRTIRAKMRGHSRSTLSVMHFRTLAYLTRNRGATLSDLAEHIGLTMPSASKLVQSLLLRGYLSRQINNRDRRKSVLAPTSKGIKIHESARAATRQHLAHELARIPAARRQKIIGAMVALKEVFLEDACPRGCATNNPVGGN